MNLWRSWMDDHGLQPTHQIIGVDPGGTTGLFNLIVLNDQFVLIDSAQVDTLLQPEGIVKSWLTVGYGCGVPVGRTHVAIEKYVITKRTARLTRQPDALEVTGAMKAVAKTYKAHVWEYTPAKSKKFASDDLLDRIGWMPKKSKRLRHARDAARQVWSCLADVDFPTWESCWEEEVAVIDGEKLIIESMTDAIFGGKEQRDGER